MEFRRRTEDALENRREDMETEGTNWKQISEILTKTAENTCGRRTRQVANPRTVGHEELAVLSMEIEAWVDRRNQLTEQTRTRRIEPELKRTREHVRTARRNMKRRLRELERRWWDEIINKCEEADRRGNIGEVYKTLRKLGTRGKETELRQRNSGSILKR